MWVRRLLSACVLKLKIIVGERFLFFFFFFFKGGKWAMKSLCPQQDYAKCYCTDEEGSEGGRLMWLHVGVWEHGAMIKPK